MSETRRHFRPEIEALESSGIVKVAGRRLGDPDVIPLWFGEGDLPTPEPIRDAAKQALDDGQTFYNFARGRKELRDGLKRYLDRLYGIHLHPDRITVPASTMLSITIAAQMSLKPGDHAIIASPNWPNIETTMRITGAETEQLRQVEVDGRWGLDLDALEAMVRPNTRALFINTPCNPTGYVMREPEMERVLELCRSRGIVLIADEVYHRNVFDADVAPSFLPLAREDDPVIIVNGFSKAWAMTGWRIGWMITPQGYADRMAVLAEVFNTGATSFVQFGAIAALERDDIVHDLRTRYAASREVLLERLGNHQAIELLPPEGAFYAFPRIRGVEDSLAFALGLLEEEDVGVAPGYTFGPGNDAHVRLCFAMSPEKLDEALRRFVRYVERRL